MTAHEIIPLSFVVSEDALGKRLDAYLAEKFSDKFSRTKVKKMIEAGDIKVDGKQASAHYLLKGREKIHIEDHPPDESGARAQDIPLKIVYEDNDLIIVDKPAGLVVHPAHGHLDNTLVNALLYHTGGSLSEAGGTVRPGIVHRLDKDTSGILVVAKNDRAHRSLAKQFKNHTIERTYFAVVRGVVQHDEGMCEEPVGRAFLNRKKVIVKPSGGKTATTYFKVEKRYAKHTLLRVHPKTGRTHQIRVHMAHMNFPILGDLLYGVASQWIDRQALHAGGLGFMHPSTHKKMSFKSDLPEDMKFLLKNLE